MPGFFDFFKAQKKKSASVASDRLQVIVAHERKASMQPDWMPKMQEEILAVIKKYVDIDSDALEFDIKNDDDLSILEINVDCPLSKVG